MKFPQKYLVNGSLTIYCEIEASRKEQDLSGRSKCVRDQLSAASEDQLAKDLEELFANMKFTDVTLLLRGGRQFQVHKSILATRSPVFAAMLEHPTKEKLSDVVEITDIEPEVFQVLRYIYTAQLPRKRLDEIAAELLAARMRRPSDEANVG